MPPGGVPSGLPHRRHRPRRSFAICTASAGCAALSTFTEILTQRVCVPWLGVRRATLSSAAALWACLRVRVSLLASKDAASILPALPFGCRSPDPWPIAASSAASNDGAGRDRFFLIG
ncbi:unnamed protein product [Ectocarpus sp. 12 AP-2014]